ncbi:hypothetical protein MVEN_02207400 [Mycena venus]|uniref:Copper transport protein n=1 Tax=Mycena venus TaxID=2733690 RepID=A0A8H6X7R0_9AGAR|nr:hypothetical protein MVEN_02207400 [Mycena venus]
MDSMMNMTDSGSSNTTSSDSMSMMMMKTYLHFTPGDTFLFKSIVPLFGRSNLRSLPYSVPYFGRRPLPACRRPRCRTQPCPEVTYHFPGAAGNGGDSAASDSKIPTSEVDTPTASNRFILSHELSRGMLAGLQTTIHYILMLIVMTFNAVFIISVIVGAIVGEVAFGRLNR